MGGFGFGLDFLVCVCVDVGIIERYRCRRCDGDGGELKEKLEDSKHSAVAVASNQRFAHSEQYRVGLVWLQSRGRVEFEFEQWQCEKETQFGSECRAVCAIQRRARNGQRRRYRRRRWRR